MVVMLNLFKRTPDNVHVSDIAAYASAKSLQIPAEIATMRNLLIGYIFQSYNLVNRTKFRQMSSFQQS